MQCREGLVLGLAAGAQYTLSLAFMKKKNTVSMKLIGLKTNPGGKYPLLFLLNDPFVLWGCQEPSDNLCFQRDLKLSC